MTHDPRFDHPTEVLRERCVRHRYGKPGAFGMEMVEPWLHRLESNRSDDPHPWDSPSLRATLHERFGESTHAAERGAIIVQCATPVNGVPVEFGARISDECPALATATVGHHADGSNLYHCKGRQVLIFVTDGVGYRLTPDQKLSKGGVLVQYATIDDVFDLLLWETTDRRPKADAALAWLKEQCAEAIRFERETTVRAFDQAAAISPDGKRLCVADWVLVLLDPVRRGPRNAVWFPGSAFAGNKIAWKIPDRPLSFSNLPKRDPDIRHETDIGEVMRRLANNFDRVRTDEIRQGLLRPAAGTVFVTHVDACPNPLPDGGTPALP